MPIYEYECNECGCRTEVVQKASDSPLKKCQSCGGTLKKLISPPAIQFKGSGWYITDYARKPSSPEVEKTKPEGKDDPASVAPSNPEKKLSTEKD
ncbi:MAG: FmdB family zinc ribbon protein [Acidobacteriota bacterium]